MPSAPDASSLPAPSKPFEDWQKATAALRAANLRGVSQAELARLTAEVVRTRYELTMDRRQAGWEPPDDILQHLVADEHTR
jgi:hypothetical protein